MEDKNSEKKIDISNSKNIVQGSNIEAGGNIHFGDVIHNYPSGKEAQRGAAGKEELEETRKLISRGRVEKAIEKLLPLAAEKDEDMSDEIHLYSRQWQKLKKDERMGIISSNDATVQGNKITMALLQFIRQIEQE